MNTDLNNLTILIEHIQNNQQLENNCNHCILAKIDHVLTRHGQFQKVSVK